MHDSGCNRSGTDDHGGMRLGEGTGALCAIPMLDMACSVYQGSTFGELSIEAYEEQGSQL